MAKTTTAHLFVTSEGALTAASFWILVGLPLTTKWFWSGCGLILWGLASALMESMEQEQLLSRQETQEAARYRNLTVTQLVEALQEEDAITSDDDKLRILELLSKRIQKQQSNDASDAVLYAVEAVYLVLQEDTLADDLILEACFSLLVLSAPNETVLLSFHSNDLDYHVPLLAMRSSLQRAQSSAEETQETAQVQRKASLWLGALADASPKLAGKLASGGAIDALLNAMDWFRYHEEVHIWGLWALFNYCSLPEGGSKMITIKGGIPKVLQSMQHNIDTIEVCRHGLAVLFACLLSDDDDSFRLKTAQVAIEAGLYSTLLQAMHTYGSSMEIMGLSTELLSQCGYEGDIPIYQPME